MLFGAIRSGQPVPMRLSQHVHPAVHDEDDNEKKGCVYAAFPKASGQRGVCEYVRGGGPSDPQEPYL
jgi:hypothetical protein